MAAVVEQGSVSLAVRAVDLTLPAVTPRGAKLEAAKGISASRTDFTKVRISVRKGPHPQLVGPLRDWEGA